MAVVSLTLGTSKTSVTTHDRNLAIVGLRAVGGRGKGPAAMTPSDAANLLIAVICSRSIKDSVATVEHFHKQASALARDIEKAMTGKLIRDVYEFHLPSTGDAFYRVGFTSRTVMAIAELLRK